jgi:hypothetical protein
MFGKTATFRDVGRRGLPASPPFPFALEAVTSKMNPGQNPYFLSLVQWLMPVIPATQETEIVRVMVQGQPG